MATPFAITPAILLQAYRAGLFPMAEDADAKELHWYDPPERTIFPLDTFHVPRRLRRTIRKLPYAVTCDQDFLGVINGCAQTQPGLDRDATWINPEIIALYTALHQQGQAHSIEAWEGNRLVGGLYGVQIGGAFCGESMFSTATDASKICLVYLVALLNHQGFKLLDCQFENPHLLQFGAQTISRSDYHQQLQTACALQCSLTEFTSDVGRPLTVGASDGGALSGSVGTGKTLDGLALAFLHAMTHTS